jgi:colanic acid/amylovoran biosynthesis glycosyltransferase
MRNIALITPNEKTTSETFVKAHKELLEGNISYLFGGNFPTHSEDLGRLVEKPSLLMQLLHKSGLYRLNTPEDALANYLRKKKIDIVFVEYGTTGAAVYEVCKKVGIPMIVHFHGFDIWYKPIVDLNLARYKHLFDYCSFIIGVSKQMINRLEEIGAASDKLVYTPCGPNNRFLEVSPSFESNTFLSIGRFVDKKAPYLTMAAFRIVYQENKEARLIFAGNGAVPNDLTEVCLNLRKLWELEECVTFAGAVTHSEIPSLMQRSFCFLQHSITTSSGDSEGTPVAVLEAGLAGLPVIATRHAGIMDVVDHGKTGYLVAEFDINGMANHMLNLLNDKKKASSIGASAREFVKNNFSLDRHIGILNDCIAQAIQNKSRS